jgi:hypothetical protein
MHRFVIATLVGFLGVVSATAALAQTVSSNVEGNNGGVLTSDPQGPSASAVSSGLTFSGTATLDFSGDGLGQAAIRPDGIGAVLADAIFVNGMTGNFVEARTLWTDTATNNTALPVNYVFDFLITPPSLRIADFAGLPDASNNAPDISFHVTIRANSVIVFEAEAHLIGGDLSHVLVETGTSLSPSFVPGSVFGYDFQSYTDVIGLGAVAPGGTMTVEYEMVARVDTPGFEAGGRAQIGDPFDLDGTPGFSGTLMEETPLPTENASWGQVKSLYR